MSKIPSNVLPGSAGRLSGIDFSSNNFGGQSVATAATNFKKDIQGQQFTFIKSTEGTGYTNPYFASQWKIAGQDVKSGKMALRVGYHFLDAGTASNGEAQAKKFLATVGVKGKLPAGTRLALDWEGAALGTPAVLKGAADYIHKVTGQWPIVYTSSGSMAAAHAQVPDAPKWEANYGPTYKGLDNEGGKILPSASDKFDQYSDGRGYGKPYDMNVYNGSLASLKKFAGDTTTTKPVHPKPPAPPPVVKKPAPKPVGKPGPTLQDGSTGAQVERAQKLLISKGFKLGTADGDFGPKTLAAVEAFQRAKGLEVDGVIGPKTWAKLLAK